MAEATKVNKCECEGCQGGDGGECQCENCDCNKCE
jgi:hypothetical protein